jgi:ribosome maturation factor RimP
VACQAIPLPGMARSRDALCEARTRGLDAKVAGLAGTIESIRRDLDPVPAKPCWPVSLPLPASPRLLSKFILKTARRSTILGSLALSGDEVSGWITHFFYCLNKENFPSKEMTASNALDPSLMDELKDVARASGCELLACEFKGSVLRLVIDRPEGVTIDDCQQVSKQASALLDVADFGSNRYLLEVSSPGLDRKFYSTEDYERYLGRKIRITWRDPAEGGKVTRVGILEAFDRAQNQIGFTDRSSGEARTISLENIELARLEPEF